MKKKSKDVIETGSDTSFEEQYYLLKLKALNDSETNEEILKMLRNIESFMEAMTESFESIADCADRIRTCIEFIQGDTECLRTAASSRDYN